MELPCLVVAVNLCGRLGNLLFQIAALMSAAEEANGRLCLAFQEGGPSDKYRSNILREAAVLFQRPDVVQRLRLQTNSSETGCRATELSTAHGRYLASGDSSCAGEKPFAKFCGRSGRRCARLDGEVSDGWSWPRRLAEALLGSAAASPRGRCSVITVSGYFEDLRYTDGHLPWIRRLFWHWPSVKRAARELAKLLPERFAAVSVHFRLGDLLVWFPDWLVHENYQKDSCVEARERIGANMTCLIFSDSPARIEHAARRLPGCRQRLMLTSYDEITSFYMMSLLPNNIISASSFSFWAAILRPKKHLVIAPEINHFRAHHFVQPIDWVRVPAHHLPSCKYSDNGVICG